MSLLAWIMIGLAAGIIARMHARAGASHRLIITAVFGVTGSLLGAVAAIEWYGMKAAQGFFDPPTWTAATVGAAVLLFLLHLSDGRGRGRRSGKPGPVRGQE